MNSNGSDEHRAVREESGNYVRHGCVGSTPNLRQTKCTSFETGAQ